jgi:hypothetical protein
MSSYPQVLDSLRAPVRPVSDIRLSAALLLPNFCAVVFLVTLLEVLFLSSGGSGLFQDSDTGWHVRNGEAILQNFAIPRSDPFSYTRAGQEWFAWEWLSDTALGAAHTAAGLPGVALLAAFSIAVTVWGVARLALALGANIFATAGAVVLLLGTSSIHWLARPHIFSWLFALVFIAVAEQERRSRSRGLYWLGVIACIWANVHGSFLLGPAILASYAIGARALESWRTLKLSRIEKAAILSFAATFVNPYGWRLHEHIVMYLRSDYLMDRIGEFRSFSFHSAGAYYVELFLVVAICGIFALISQRAFGPAILGIVMLHLSMYSARHLPVAAVLLLPLSAAALTLEARKRGWLTSVLSYSDRLRAIDRRVLGYVPIVLGLIATTFGLSALARNGAVTFSSKDFPVEAANFIQRNHLTARIFAKDQWGGYLIYRFRGQVPVFIDGRSDFYGPKFLETYSEIIEAKPLWSSRLNEYKVGVVLIPTNHALASVLVLSPQWKRIYSDEVASMFERVS